jgi:hypothetical protein
MVPDELKAYPQWVLWRERILENGKRTKIPFSVYGNIASATDRNTWASYDEAVNACHRLAMNGIGFVLTENDPFGVIDLDNPFVDLPEAEGKEVAERHSRIIQAFNSYTEVSPSGEGMHIWVKGSVPIGRRRKKVEVYSKERFFTVTGNTFLNQPINDRSDLLNILWNELDDGKGSYNVEVQEQEQKFTDRQIYEQAREAENGEKFLNLWEGRWMEAHYSSQSEADFALIDILSFYSRNVDQIRRLFFQSALGQRDKAKRRNYIDGMIKRSFDNQPLILNLDTFRESVRQQIEAKAPTPNPFAGPLFENLPDPTFDWTVPPGLLGEIATFIYASSVRQVKEIALAAAVGLMSGICGRQYNVSGTGLNQYILLLASTGTGKESMRSGIDKIMRHVKPIAPAAMEFIGPNEIASGQAIVKYLPKVPCFVSIVGEFGLFMQQMCAHNASQPLVQLRRKLLDLYNKSGEKDVMQPTIYSDKDKNTSVVQSPCLTILGESIPEAYYGGLDEGMIAQGLLPRFLTIEYNGSVPHINEGHEFIEPPIELINRIAELAVNCHTLAHNGKVIKVQLNEEATKFSRDYSHKITANINKTSVDVYRQLWNRAHLKVLKLASLIAIGTDMYNPMIDLESIKWAHILVERDINNILHKFESGQVGRNTSEAFQIMDLSSIIKEYLCTTFNETLQKYGVNSMMHADRVISYSYFLRRLQLRTSFKNDRMGATFAIKRAIEALITDGSLRELRQVDIRDRYGKIMKAYAITDIARFI